VGFVVWEPQKLKTLYCFPSRNGCVAKTQGGLLNKRVKAREVLTPEQRWEDLIAELSEMAAAPWPNEVRVAYLMPRFGSLNLIQPFDWMRWTEPFPETKQAKILDLETAIKHITRICRAERFYENSIWSHIRSGLLIGLCLVVREHTRGEIVRNVFEVTN
jgi:hypothetical protein